MKKIMLIVLGIVLTLPALAQYGSRRYPIGTSTSGHFSQPHYSDISHDYFDTSHTGSFFVSIGVNF